MMRVPYCFGDLKRDLILENGPSPKTVHYGFGSVEV